MTPYKNIEESKKILKTLASEFSNMDNSNIRLSELNVLVRMINDYEKLLEGKYYTDFFDTLILSRMYQTLLKGDFTEVNINEFIEFIEQDFRVGNLFIRNQIVDLLISKQQYNSLVKGCFYNDKKETWGNIIESTLKRVKNKIVFLDKYKK